MKEKTKAYAAGIFDAEGCISIARSVRPGGYIQYHVMLKVSNKDRRLMRFLVKTFGGTFKPVPNNGDWIYNWTITNANHLCRYLSLIRPHLQIKAKEADLAFEYCALNGAPNPEKREELHRKMKAFKNRSVETNTQGFSCRENLINAYYAGLFDGEGDLGISEYHPRRRSTACYYGYARCKNTFKPIIDLMPGLYGGRLSTRSDDDHGNWLPQRIWRLSKKENLESFLLKVLPYLVSKREQAKLLLNFVRLGVGPTDGTRQFMYEDMRKLNNP